MSVITNAIINRTVYHSVNPVVVSFVCETRWHINSFHSFYKKSIKEDFVL